MVDEIGQEKYVAYRETSEFSDELDIVVYRSSQVTPPEILELMSQGDLPDEIKNANKYKLAKKVNAAKAREKKRTLEIEKATIESVQTMRDEEIKLNSNKRDRRTTLLRYMDRI